MAHDRGHLTATLWRRKRLLLTCMLVVGAATSVAAYSYPVRYRSQAVFEIVPGRDATNHSTAPASKNLDERLATMEEETLTRKRLERIIEEYNLYPDARRHDAVEEVIDRMRRDISVVALPGNSFRVAFDADNPRLTQKVSMRLASLFIDDSVRNMTISRAGPIIPPTDGRIQQAHQTLDAKEREIAERNRDHRPVSRADTIEYEVLQQDYRDLITKREQGRTLAVTQRPVGDRLRLVDPPRIPTAPITPNRLAVSTGGALAGLGLGVAFVGITSRRGKKEEGDL